MDDMNTYGPRGCEMLTANERTVEWMLAHPMVTNLESYLDGRICIDELLPDGEIMVNNRTLRFRGLYVDAGS